MMPLKERATFTVLAIAGVLALFFGIWRIGHNINSPFARTPLDKTEKQEDTWLEMQAKDTDGDGLSDYEETYVYGTSPYLEDSDSDGKSDNEEISSESDPNCPEGKDCDSALTAPDSSVGFDVPGSPDSLGLPKVSEPETNDSQEVDITNLSVEDIRDLLRVSGIDDEFLEQLDDAALMDIYDEALKKTK